MKIILAVPQAHIAENPGWGKLAFLVGAGLLFWLFVSAHTRMKKLHDEGHSPASVEGPAGGLKPQASARETETRETASPPRGRASAVADDDLVKFVEKHAERLPTKDVVRLARAQFSASRATVFRRLKEARERKEYGP